MKNPRLEVDLSKIQFNAKNIVSRCQSAGIEVTGVTKSFGAYYPIVKVFIESGIHCLADARMQNIRYLKRMKTDAELMLLRIPMLSEVKDLVSYGDMSVNSEIETIKAISKESCKQGKTHGIILMVDLGDLREGFWPDEVMEAAKQCRELPNIEVKGLATNYGCFGGVLPTVKNTAMLAELGKEVEKIVGYPMKMISVGGTVAFKLIENANMPAGITHLRIGEGITMGTDTTGFERKINNTFQDAFTFISEIVELKEKPSVPIGDIGYDGFSETPVFVDKGMRKRAICAVGKQDLFIESLSPKLPGIEILGASSDHMILDITDCQRELKVGDELEFGINWSNMLRLTTSKYVRKMTTVRK